MQLDQLHIFMKMTTKINCTHTRTFRWNSTFLSMRFISFFDWTFVIYFFALHFIFIAMFCAVFSVLNLEIVLDSTDDLLNVELWVNHAFNVCKRATFDNSPYCFGFWFDSCHNTAHTVKSLLNWSALCHYILHSITSKKKHMHIFRSVFYRTCQLFVKFENSQHTVNYRWPLNKPQKSTESHVWLWNPIFSHCLMKVACNSVVVLCVFFLSTTRIPLEWSTVRI